LVGHNMDDQVGVIESARIDEDRRGRAVVRFGRSERASEIFNDVVDGIRTKISVGYSINEMALDEERSNDDADVYRVTRWQPFEASFVSVPADNSAAVGRAKTTESNDSKIQTDTRVKTMSEDIKKNDINVDVIKNEAADAARKAEQKRVSEVMATAEAYDAFDLGRQVINQGGDVNELNKLILERKSNKPVEIAEDPNLGMTEKEIRDYSFVRILNALANPNDKRAQSEAGFEFEMSQAAQDKMNMESRGAVVPFDVLSANRAHTVGTAADGGNLVETSLLSGSFIQKLEDAMTVREAGATMLTGLNGNIAIPRQTGGASTFWLAENGTSTESSATFDQVALSPKTIGAHTEISRKTLLQSSIAVESFVQNELALRLALGINQACINGSGASNQPRGILNVAGIGSVTGQTGYDLAVDLETAVDIDNALMGSLSYLTNAKVRGLLKKTQMFASSNGMPVWMNDEVNGYRAFVSNQVPSNLGAGSDNAVIFGNFADLLIGMWGGLDLQVNPYSLDTSGAIRVTAFQDIDLAVRHPESFAAATDLTIA